MSCRERLDGEYRAIDKTSSPLERLMQRRARTGEVDAKGMADFLLRGGGAQTAARKSMSATQ